jgi:hypothetical protein
MHDADGALIRLVVNPPDAPGAMVAARHGELVTEVDASSFKLDLAKPDSLLKLAAMLKTHRVEPRAPARLVTLKAKRKA